MLINALHTSSFSRIKNLNEFQIPNKIAFTVEVQPSKGEQYFLDQFELFILRIFSRLIELKKNGIVFDEIPKDYRNCFSGTTGQHITTAYFDLTGDMCLIEHLERKPKLMDEVASDRFTYTFFIK